MSEIFSSVNLKNKITIASSLLIFAVVLITVIGIITASSTDIHKHKYDYTLSVNTEGSFELSGVCTVKNCESPYYSESGVDVIIYSYEKPTCSKEGTKVYSCIRDGVTVKLSVKVATTLHSYEGEIVNGANGQYASGHCVYDGCNATGVIVNDLNKFKLDTVVAATCSTPKKEIYKCNLSDGTFTLEVERDEYLPHTLNGVYVDSDKAYPQGTNGITLPSGTNGACNSTVNGNYTCEKCNQTVSVKVLLPGHSFVYGVDKVTPPTLEADGEAILCCENSVCTETEVEVLPKVEIGVNTVSLSPATELYLEKVKYTYESSAYGFTYENVYEIGEVLAHNTVYDLIPDSDNTGAWNVISKKCDQADCQADEIVVAWDVDAKLIKDTTSCQGPGELEWEYEYEGHLLKASAYVTFPSEHKYTSHSHASFPNLERPGSIQLHCEKCGEAITIELPKIIVGTNAIFIEETADGGFVYKYTYKTEYNYTVELMITLYQSVH